MIQARQLHAPRQPGGLLAEPSLAEVGALLERNRAALTGTSFEVLGRSAADLRGAARHSLLATARAYMRRAGEPLPDLPDTDSLLLAGHQPELFHPGVWVKNFALHALARAHGTIPVNLVVDNDTAKTTALKLPGWEERGTPAGVRRFTVPFDRWTREVPYEERQVLDEAEFASFPARAAAITRDWGFEPILAAFWEEVERQARRTSLLGERFAAARRTFERRWGCHNLEVPLGEICAAEPFAIFAIDLLRELPRFHRAYNEALREYRAQYDIHSRFHPVPELAAEGDWLEAPLWAWRAEDPQRGRLMARLSPAGIELRAGNQAWPTIPVNRDAAVQRWREMHEEGYKIRSRALTTTLYARLFLSDLFIHGIGGAKYDELTDEIARRFYGYEPPAYLVLSATLLLPLAAYPAHPDDSRRLARQLRDVRWNPQRHLPTDGAASNAARALADEKQRWMTLAPPTRAGRRERFRRLSDLTRQLQPYVRTEESPLAQRLQRCAAEVEANAILRRRDYAFCLYPEESLRGLIAKVQS